MSYVDEIDAEIDRLRVQLVKLEHAREVMSKLEKRGPKTLELAAEKPVKKGPMYTISKKLPDKQARKKPQMTVAELGELALTAVAEKPGMTGTEVAKHLGIEDEAEQKRVWYALKRAVDEGRVRKDGPLYHPLEGQPDALAAE